MRKFLWVMFSIIVIIFGAITVISTLDWNHYKGSLSSLVKNQTGYVLEFNGPVNLHLFPTLYFKANDVRIKNKSGFKAQNLAVLKSVHFKAEILPLLRGKIKISDVDLVEPMFYLESQKNGQKNWENASSSPKNNGLDPTSKSDDSPIDLHIKGITIEKGFVSYADLHTGSTHTIKDINMEGSLDLPQELFSVSGHLNYQDYALKGVMSSSSTRDHASALKADVRVLKNHKDFGSLHWDGTLKDGNLLGDLKLDMLSIPDILKGDGRHNKLLITSKVKGNKEKLHFSSLSFHLPSIEGTGSASLSLLEDTPKIEASLSIPKLTLGENKASSDSSPNPDHSKAAPKWSLEKWNISFPDTIDFLCTANVDSFHYDAYLLRQLSTTITLKKGHLNLSHIKANGYKGHVNGSCSLFPHGNALTLTSDVNLQNIDLGSLPDSPQGALKEATVNAHLVLKTTGNSTAEAIRHLGGSTHINVTNAVIETVDIKSFVDHAKHVKGPQDIVSLMQAFKKKALVPFSFIKADFALQNGRASTTNGMCESEDISALIKGFIDLPAWHMDMDAKVKIKSLDKIPAIGVKAVGDLSDPSLEVDKDILAKLFLTKTMDTVVNHIVKSSHLGPLGDAIQGAMGLKKESSDTHNADTEQVSDPKKGLKEAGKMLKGLFG